MHPILFKFQGLTIYAYGFCVALAVTLALVISIQLAPRKHLSPSTAVDLLFISFVSGITGARLFYVMQHLEAYRAHWISIFWIQEGGLVWYGGFIFAVLAGVIYCRRHRLSVLRWTDFFAPLLSLAHGIGRIGCFLNGCCYGRTTNLFFGMRFSEDRILRHPAQLYESSGLFIITAVLFLRASKKNHPGEVTAWYLFLYSGLRFFVEFLRGDQLPIYFLTLPQWISALIFLFAVFFLKRCRATLHENKH